jgi:NitT/TauT family transport system substrate-binding protein
VSSANFRKGPNRTPLLMRKIGSFLLILLYLSAAHGQAEEVVQVGIGTQDTTINCAAGGPVVRELKLLEKYLPHDGKYQDVRYEIHWVNLPTGAQLNNELLAGRLEIVSMADFPSILGYDALLSKNDGVKTLYIASLSLGLHGAGNALLVPLNSSVQSIADLKGKSISVPFASTAHAFLLRAIQTQGWDPNKDVRIVTQAPEIGGSALKSGQIDAHADFVPFGELFPFRGFARKILDGESTGVTTTHGIQVRSDFAQKYPEIVVAYLRAALEGDRLIRENPESMAEQYQKWTGIEAEVFYAFHGPQGIQTRDYTLKPEVIGALGNAAQTLKVLKKTAHDIDIGTFVDDRYIREAAKQSGDNYEARLKNYDPVPFEAKDFQGRPVTEPKAAGQIWVAGEPKVRLYQSIAATFQALQALEKEGGKARVTYVHDAESGLKLFADKVWYVRAGEELAAFLEKSKAEKWAASHTGTVIDFAGARQVATVAQANVGR